MQVVHQHQGDMDILPAQPTALLGCQAHEQPNQLLTGPLQGQPQVIKVKWAKLMGS